MDNSINEDLLSGVYNFIEQYRIKQAVAATIHYKYGMPSTKQLAVDIIRLVKKHEQQENNNE